jgi:hypothetical protein
MFCKLDNLQNRQCIKYLFSPLEVCVVHSNFPLHEMLQLNCVNEKVDGISCYWLEVDRLWFFNTDTDLLEDQKNSWYQLMGRFKKYIKKCDLFVIMTIRTIVIEHLF